VRWASSERDITDEEKAKEEADREKTLAAVTNLARSTRSGDPFGADLYAQPRAKEPYKKRPASAQVFATSGHAFLQAMEEAQPAAKAPSSTEPVRALVLPAPKGLSDWQTAAYWTEVTEKETAMFVNESLGPTRHGLPVGQYWNHFTGAVSRQQPKEHDHAYWTAVIGSDGSRYYWNKMTNETAWQLPE